MAEEAKQSCCCGSAPEEPCCPEPEKTQSCCCESEEPAKSEPCCCGETEPAEEPCCCGTETTAGTEPCCCGDSAEAEPCCCSDDDDCCSDSEFSCEDDPYAGEVTPVDVDFLYLDLTVCDRCQGADVRVAKAVERCQPIMRTCGYDLKLNMILVDTKELAEAHRFVSSPTVRVNGIDICGEVAENDCGCCSDIADTDVKCRIFSFNGKQYEVPPTDMLVCGIVRAVMGTTQAPANDTPYVMPQNLIDFYEGKERKESSGSSCCCCC